MKKNLLAAAFAAFALSANAQVATYSGLSDGTTFSEVGEGTGTITIKVVRGEGIVAPTAVQKTWKNTAGETQQFDADWGSNGMYPIKWTNNQPNDDTGVAFKNAEEAKANGQYIDFVIEETDETKVLDIQKIEFDATRLGTDATRLQVELIAEGNENLESGFYITKELAATFGDNYPNGAESNFVEATGAEGEIPGYVPSREDASKGKTENANGRSHLTIPVPAAYGAEANETFKLTLRVYGYGVKNNKSFAIYNVKAYDSATGINTTVAADVKASKKVAKTLENGQVVILKDGKKFNAAGAQLQ